MNGGIVTTRSERYAVRRWAVKREIVPEEDSGNNGSGRKATTRNERSVKRKRAAVEESDSDVQVLESDSDSESDEEEQVDYEQERNAILEQNRKRMMELGLFNLASDVAAAVKPVKNPKASPAILAARRAKRILTRSVTAATPPRRSSRLKGVVAVSYFKQEIIEEEGRGRRRRHLFEEGTKPEIYTEEDEKKLGSYEEPWQLFTDGYDHTGARIYDSTFGKTCHQCRQKTMGFRTSCSSCKALHGQFCGDCLFMRYGENVLETMKNPKWICPVCREICNCSFCRPKRGWSPTGSLYRMAIALGHKSVAHYLIHTRRAVPVPD